MCVETQVPTQDQSEEEAVKPTTQFPTVIWKTQVRGPRWHLEGADLKVSGAEDAFCFLCLIFFLSSGYHLEWGIIWHWELIVKGSLITVRLTLCNGSHLSTG